MDNHYEAHPTATIDPESIIGDNTRIWVNSQIRESAHIGNNCIISKDTYIDKEVHIGDRVKIQNGVSIYRGVFIENDVFIGPNAVFTNDLFPRAFAIDWEVKQTCVKRGASIGANATIVCGTTIGEYAMVGAGSVVTSDIPPFTLVVGNPARIVGYVCECGFRLDKNFYCTKCAKKHHFLEG